MQSLARLVLRPFALAVVAIAATLASAPVAHAQASQAVASPLTTKRLERLLKVYVSPTPEEATAIDRLHEAYLARFRAELDPEIQAVGRAMQGGMPSQQQFEKFLRDLDRLQAKIAEADNALLGSAANLVAEERRAGMQRIREARERQRELSGFTRMGPMMFGGGGSFVDLADLLARDEFVRQVPEPMREQFDALLRAQEQRLLSQSRNYGSEIRKAFDKLYAIISEAEQSVAEPAEGEDPGAAMRAQMARMQQMMQRMKELGKDANRVLELNAEANRAAVRQFESVLPEITYHRLRGDVARRSTNMMARMTLGFGGMEIEAAGDLATLLARLRRDPEVTADMRARFDPIELSWRRERADNAEKVAELSRSLDTTAMMGGMMGSDGAPNESVAALQAAQSEGEEIDQRAYRAVADVIGSEKRRQVFSTRTTLEEDSKVASSILRPIFAPTDAALSEEKELSDEPGYMGSAAALSSEPPQWSAAQVARLFRPLGASESSVAVIEGVVEDWSAREWNAKVVPLGRELAEAVTALFRDIGPRSEDSGEARPFRFDPQNQAKTSALRRSVMDAAFAADEVFFAEIGAALGLDPASAEMLVLRLERVQLATDAVSFGGAQFVASPSMLLARAKLSPEDARAFLEKSGAEWAAFADSLDEAIRASLDRDEVLQRAMQEAQSGQDWQSYQKVMAASAAASREFYGRYAALIEAAAAKASSRPEVATAIKRARLALERPDVYKRSESAIPQLERAIALDGISEDQRARLEALQAEYEAVYEMLSEKIATGGEQADPNDSEAWRAMQERMEAEEKLRFQRNERTEKARSEARRILGDELASRVRGLVPDDVDAAASRQTNRFDPFAGDDD
jgi:hypothetical protein